MKMSATLAEKTHEEFQNCWSTVTIAALTTLQLKQAWTTKTTRASQFSVYRQLMCHANTIFWSMFSI